MIGVGVVGKSVVIDQERLRLCKRELRRTTCQVVKRSGTYYALDFIQLVPRYADRQLGAWRETKSHGPSHLAPGPVVAAR
jgi:hypothetical protein